MAERRPSRHLLLPAITAALFAGSFVAAKYTTVDLEPLTTSLLRYLVAGVFLAGLVRVRGVDLRIGARDVPRLAALGLFGIVGYHYFFFLALRYTEVANTAIINALSPVATSALAAVFIGERLRSQNYVGVVVAVIGVLVLLSRGDVAVVVGLGFTRGDSFMLLAVLSWVGYALLVKELVLSYGAVKLTFYATWFGVALLVPLAWQEGLVEQVQAVSAASLWAIGYMGVAASGVGYLLYNVSIAALGPTRTASLVYSLVPILVAVLALMFFAEPITPLMVASTALIGGGLHLTLRGSRRPQNVVCAD